MNTKKNNFCILILMLYSISLFSQNIVMDEKSNKEILLGRGKISAIQKAPFEDWFMAEYNSYMPANDNINVLQNLDLQNISIEIVLATWCGDSRREVPRFFKILSYCNFNDNDVSMIYVNREKQIENEDISFLNIELVPTFIISRNGVEVGRIVETPTVSLEADLVNILINK